MRTALVIVRPLAKALNKGLHRLCPATRAYCVHAVDHFPLSADALRRCAGVPLEKRTRFAVGSPLPAIRADAGRAMRHGLYLAVRVLKQHPRCKAVCVNMVRRVPVLERRIREMTGLERPHGNVPSAPQASMPLTSLTVRGRRIYDMLTSQE